MLRAYVFSETRKHHDRPLIKILISLINGGGGGKTKAKPSWKENHTVTYTLPVEGCVDPNADSVVGPESVPVSREEEIFLAVHMQR